MRNVVFSYCDFFDSTLNGESMNDGEKPRVFGEHNFAWPQGWTREMARDYREKLGLQSPYGSPKKATTGE